MPLHYLLHMSHSLSGASCLWGKSRTSLMMWPHSSVTTFSWKGPDMAEEKAHWELFSLCVVLVSTSVVETYENKASYAKSYPCSKSFPWKVERFLQQYCNNDHWQEINGILCCTKNLPSHRITGDFQNQSWNNLNHGIIKTSVMASKMLRILLSLALTTLAIGTNKREEQLQTRWEAIVRERSKSLAFEPTLTSASKIHVVEGRDIFISCGFNKQLGGKLKVRRNAPQWGDP